jgi:acyl-coenzyme A thioesterase PaaI-like protein
MSVGEPPHEPARWSFGVEPLAAATEPARLLRRIAGLVVALDADDGALAELTDDLRRIDARLGVLVPDDLTPRVGDLAVSDGRVYVDHSRDIGAFNACFPEYSIDVDGGIASGSVTFPIAFEGPPGTVHGGFLAVLLDSVIQHHNCDVGVAGKTTSLSLRYRRPAPLDRPLRFEIVRSQENGRIASTARLFSDGVLLCEAQMEAVAGDRAALPPVSPRRTRP